MNAWNLSDLGLLAVSGYIAVASLVKLMHRRRDMYVEDARRQIQSELARRAEQRRRERKRQAESSRGRAA